MTLQILGFLVALAPLAQTDGSEPAKVAVVNVAAVSEKYARTADLEAQFEAMRQDYRAMREALRERIERMAQSLQEELKPGTEAFLTRRKELAMLEAEAQYTGEAEGRKIEEALARSLRLIFSDIQAAVRELAQEKGIDLVLASDELPDEAPATPTAARQQILLQKVLYWTPRVDLTDAVVARANATYAAKRATTPSASGG